MDQAHSAFARLRALLAGSPAPPGLEPIQLHLGESRLAAPEIDPTPLAATADWTRYPELGGSAGLRAAYGHWLTRRFGVARALTGGTIAVEPTPGTKQAVAVAIALAARPAGAASGRPPAVVMPNPYYPTYRAGTAAVGARPVFYRPDTAGDTTGDAAPVEAAVDAAGGRAAVVIVCNPGNPQGRVLPADALRGAAKAAAGAGALFVVDECYTDLALDRPPTGYLALVEADGGAPGPFLVLHSLSKRSGAPGLRSGFAAGDPATVAGYAAYNRQCGVSTPGPVNAVAAALWSDDAHVERARRALVRNWELADAALGHVPGYRRAEAGFFLWLPVRDDEGTARRLWCSRALSVMPGRYLAAEEEDGVNPGAGHLRIALVHDEGPMREALARLGSALSTAPDGEEPS
ncbi:aminotransferase class I/II-fold pyridoxal phosphate-dependent enzyme [Kitasatospora sp. NPDC089797]|uniref:aminotransferase class I/II-fold pyridoxal phosphate-dependent enzyme n=1 Tax=Kitasatospora sp. NPDC089797 TaxID=3155298 RepID=UPI003427D991